jgi:DNA polymerase I
MAEDLPPVKCLIVDLDFFIEEKGIDIEEPIIRIRGKTENNETIIIHVTGFYPYFYIDDVAETTKSIQSLLYTEKEFGDWIQDHFPITKYRYYQNKPIFLYKILGRNPWRILKYSKLLLEKGIRSYENDISYASRFLIDTDCKGLNWIVIKNYEELSENQKPRIFKVDYKDIEQTEDSDFQYNIMSFNIAINSITDDGRKIRNFSSVMKERIQRIIAVCLSWGAEEGKTKNKTFILEEDNDESEKAMLTKVIETIHEVSPEIFVTFNGNQVTLPYFFSRMETLGLDSNTICPLENAKIKPPIGYLGYRIPGYISYDLVKSTRWLRTKTGKKGLEDLAHQFLNTRRKGDYSQINDLWFQMLKNKQKDARNEIENICNHDSYIIHSLFFAMGMEEWLEVMKLVGIRPSEGIYSTPRHLGEFQLFRILHHKNTIIPAEPTRDELAIRKSTRSLAVGGFVLVPKGTLHEAVLIADFTSMFPSIMVSHNIGGESFDGSVAAPMNKFRTKPDTGLRIMQNQILEERKIVKKKIYELETYLRSFSKPKRDKKLEKELKKLKIQSNAYKVVANSMYGSHNYVGSRFYDTEISNAITSISKEYIKRVDQWTQEFTENKCQVVYGDTDSIFVKLSDKSSVFKAAEETSKRKSFSIEDVPEAKELLEYFSSKLPKQMELQFVDLALRIVFAPETKKRYSYLSAVTGELTIVGFEAIRSDTSPFAVEVQTEALKLVLEEGDIQKARQKVIDLCVEFKNLDPETIIEKTLILGPIRRNPKEYKSKTPAIGALENFAYANELDIDEIWKDYERFPFVILEGNSPLYKRARHPTLADPAKIDREHYILEALRDVKRIGVRVELQDINPSSQRTLDFSALNARRNED